MKRVSQIVTLCLLGSMLIACGDKSKETKAEETKAPQTTKVETITQEELIKTEAEQLRSITQQQIESNNFQQLFTAIAQAKTPEEQSQIFAKFVELFKANKQQILELNLETKEIQAIRTTLIDGLNDFIQLMQLVAENAGKQLTEEQQNQITQLQQSSQIKIDTATAELNKLLPKQAAPAEK